MKTILITNKACIILNDAHFDDIFKTYQWVNHHVVTKKNNHYGLVNKNWIMVPS